MAASSMLTWQAQHKNVSIIELSHIHVNTPVHIAQAQNDVVF